MYPSLDLPSNSSNYVPTKGSSAFSLRVTTPHKLPNSTNQIYDEWFSKSLVVLVAACPCALVLASPIATACSLARAAQGGVIVKSAATLERLPHITDAALDKTGTLTKGPYEGVYNHRCISLQLSTTPSVSS